MAEQENILVRLGKLFQNQLVIRKSSDGQLTVKDVNFMQSGLTSNFVDRYQKVMGSYNTSMGRYAAKQNAKNAFDMQRKELFRDYELMDEDPIISSALDIYSDESTVDNVENEILKIKSDNPKVAKILHNLFYDILNIDFNLWPWIRNLVKYGDHFMKLDISEKLHFTAGKNGKISLDIRILSEKPVGVREGIKNGRKAYSAILVSWQGFAGRGEIQVCLESIAKRISKNP